MPENAFVNYLCQLAARDDRAALAHLRRGLGKPPGSAAGMHRYVVPWLPSERNRWLEDAHYLIATLFAAHPVHDNTKRTLGETMQEVGHAADSMDSIERRFTALLNAHTDDLPEHLRHAVGLARGKGIGLNYDRLMKDLRYWGSDTRSVQRAWAKDFWRREKSTTAANKAEGE